MCDCKTGRGKQVPLELNNLDGSISDSREAIDGLEESLQGVLTPIGPSCVPDTAKNDNPKCDLANTIAAYRRRVMELAESIRELTSRIEV